MSVHTPCLPVTVNMTCAGQDWRMNRHRTSSPYIQTWYEHWVWFKIFRQSFTWLSFICITLYATFVTCVVMDKDRIQWKTGRTDRSSNDMTRHSRRGRVSDCLLLAVLSYVGHVCLSSSCICLSHLPHSHIPSGLYMLPIFSPKTTWTPVMPHIPSSHLDDDIWSIYHIILIHWRFRSRWKVSRKDSRNVTFSAGRGGQWEGEK